MTQQTPKISHEVCSAGAEAAVIWNWWGKRAWPWGSLAVGDRPWGQEQPATLLCTSNQKWELSLDCINRAALTKHHQELLYIPDASIPFTVKHLQNCYGHCYLSMTAVFDAGAQVLAVGGCRAASVRRGQGCPMPEMASSSQPQPTHHRAQLYL